MDVSTTGSYDVAAGRTDEDLRTEMRQGTRANRYELKKLDEYLGWSYPAGSLHLFVLDRQGGVGDGALELYKRVLAAAQQGEHQEVSVPQWIIRRFWECVSVGLAKGNSDMLSHVRSGRAKGHQPNDYTSTTSPNRASNPSSSSTSSER